MSRKVYVVEAYVPNGGTYMAYHVARILHLDFGYEVYVLTDNPDLDKGHAHGMFSYEPLFPCLPLSKASTIVRNQDVLICNPSFSAHNFGLKVRGMKIMYIQGFTTFSVLDRFFDYYVSVGNFTHNFLKNIYDLESTIIPAFLEDPPLESPAKQSPPEWSQRRPYSVTLNLKGEVSYLLLSRLREILKTKDRNLEVSIDWDGAIKAAQKRKIHKDFISTIAASRYLLTLSVAEGFGLVPLEAMAVGTVVMGFDGFGGRDYMVTGKNCAVCPYPDVLGVAEQMIKVIGDTNYAQTLSALGIKTAARYNYKTFRKAWIAKLSRILCDKPIA